MWKAHRIQLIVLFIAFVVLVTLALVPVDYVLVAPGYNHSVSRFITIEDDVEMDGSIHTTSVIVLEEMRALQYLVGPLFDSVSISEQPAYYDNIDIDDLRIQGFIAKDDSIARSLIVGIEAAGHTVNYTSEMIVTMTYSYLDDNSLELEDVVVSLNGNTDISQAAAALDCGDVGTFDIMRDGNPLTVTASKHDIDGSCLFGVTIQTITELISTDIEYILHDSNTGGASGGLMQSLYIYNALTPNDITGGNMIAGSGTIAIDGSVGLIGGIRQKIITSVINGVDIFFVPHLSDEPNDNYIVAQAVLEELDSDMRLVPVSTFAEAVSYLERRYGGAFDEE
jgi:PDZ domain-containing protein